MLIKDSGSSVLVVCYYYKNNRVSFDQYILFVPKFCKISMILMKEKQKMNYVAVWLFFFLILLSLTLLNELKRKPSLRARITQFNRK